MLLQIFEFRENRRGRKLNYIYACAAKPYDILKAKNALLTSVSRYGAHRMENVNAGSVIQSVRVTYVGAVPTSIVHYTGEAVSYSSVSKAF
jgi:hypothetical protein